MGQRQWIQSKPKSSEGQVYGKECDDCTASKDSIEAWTLYAKAIDERDALLVCLEQYVAAKCKTGIHLDRAKAVIAKIRNAMEEAR